MRSTKITLAIVSAIIAMTALAYLYFYQATQSINLKNRSVGKDNLNKPKVVCNYSASKTVVLDNTEGNQGCLYLGCGSFF